MVFRFEAVLIAFALVAAGWTSSCIGQAALQPTPAAGSITGIVVDQSGALVAGAGVKLARTAAKTGTDKTQSPIQTAVTGGDGKFSFANVAPGAFQLTIAAP